MLIIDPGDYTAVLERCKEAASVTVLLTHEHFDHVIGLNRVMDCCASSCRVIAGEICSERIQDTKANLSAYADVLDLHFVGDTVLENNLMVKFPGSSKKLYRSVTVPLLEKWLLGNRVSCVYPGHGDVMSPEKALGLIRDI